MGQGPKVNDTRAFKSIIPLQPISRQHKGRSCIVRFIRYTIYTCSQKAHWIVEAEREAYTSPESR